MKKASTVLSCLLGWTYASGLAIAVTPEDDLSPTKIVGSGDALVLVLGGAYSPTEIGGDAQVFRDVVATKYCESCEKHAVVRIWDWAKLFANEDGIGERAKPDHPVNIKRAKRLAGYLQGWKDRNKNSPVYLVAGSAGAVIGVELCKVLSSDFRFERILFLSSHLPPDTDLLPVLKRQKEGFFTYFSKKDIVWNTGKAGERGFQWKSSYKPFRSKWRALEWIKKNHSTLGNDGGHLACYSTEFCQKYLLPLLDLESGQKIPDEWKNKGT